MEWHPCIHPSYWMKNRFFVETVSLDNLPTQQNDHRISFKTFWKITQANQYYAVMSRNHYLELAPSCLSHPQAIRVLPLPSSPLPTCLTDSYSFPPFWKRRECERILRQPCTTAFKSEHTQLYLVSLSS